MPDETATPEAAVDPIKLPAQVTDLNSVPEQYRALYAPSGEGVFTTTIEMGDMRPASDFSNVESEMQAEKAKRETLEKDLQQLQSTVGASDIKSLMSELERFKTDNAKSASNNVDANEARQQLAAEHNLKMKNLDDQWSQKYKAIENDHAALRNTSRASIKQNALANALRETGATIEGAELLLSRMNDYVGFESDDSDNLVVYNDPNTKIPAFTLKGSESKGKTAVDLAGDMREKYPALFASTTSSLGGDAKTSVTPSRNEKMSLKDYQKKFRESSQVDRQDMYTRLSNGEISLVD